MKIEARLKELGITLPKPSTPSANYVPTRSAGPLVFVSGQVTTVDGKDTYVGKVGAEFTVEEGQAAARICAINVLAQLKLAIGDLDRVRACVRLGGFVNATPEFTSHPLVINGASDLMVEVFGERGRHARAAVGCGSLPRNSAVEVEAIFEVG